jgi:S-methylmethionine-dependent homocysteine/selenocysteine methylase
MSLHRNKLPQLSGDTFLSDAGIETFLIFHEGAKLPFNAAYVLLQDDAGVAQLTRYFDHYLPIARQYRTGFILESATWRASPDWAAKIGTSPDELARLNRRAIEMLLPIRERYAKDVSPIVISGAIGPRSDAYRPTEIMSESEAERYHSVQIGTFAGTEADLVSGVTITNVPEAVGIVRAAQAVGMPAVIAFTVETDGRLPTGPTLREAIEKVDDVTKNGPAYYMINCAHPTHFEPSLKAGESWTKRIHAVRANSSKKSHAELDESPTIDEGNPKELGAQYRALRERFPQINVLGGCCGTDHRHIAEIAAACLGKGRSHD